MPRQASIHRVLIASPSDVSAERDAVEDAVLRWNAAHSANIGVMYEPVRWERNVVSQMGAEAQKTVNRQIVDDSDVLVGIFWSILGTPTSTDASGTVEEINRFLRDSRPVSLYFSTRELPGLDGVDTGQIRKLKDFKDQCQRNGVFGTFGSVSQLKEQVDLFLTKTAYGFTPKEPAFEVRSNLSRTKNKDEYNASPRPFDGQSGEFIIKRLSAEADEKRRIALHIASHYVHDYDSVFLDAGSTAETLAEELFVHRKFLSVITNNIGIFKAYSRALETHPLSVNEFLFAGGRYNPMLNAVFGSVVQSSLKAYTPTVTVIGVSGLSACEGLFCHGIEEIDVKKLYWCKPTSRRIVAADWSKFGRRDAHIFSSSIHDLVAGADHGVIVTAKPREAQNRNSMEVFERELSEFRNEGIQVDVV